LFRASTKSALSLYHQCYRKLISYLTHIGHTSESQLILHSNIFLVQELFFWYYFQIFKIYILGGTAAEWDVVYCSVPTSPGGGYRTAIGRLIFKTKDMVQAVETPDIVRNRVSFSLFGFIDGQVSLKGNFLFDSKS
jgi:hypothetical protein